MRGAVTSHRLVLKQGDDDEEEEEDVKTYYHHEWSRNARALALFPGIFY